MAAQPEPYLTDERQALAEFVAAQQYAFRAAVFGLTDEQARATPSVSALSVGALVKHATGVQHSWMQRVAHAPNPVPADDRTAADQQREYDDEFVMREDETLAGLLASFDAQNAQTLGLIGTADLSAPVPIPPEVPWFPKGVDAWTVRYVFFHMVEELARHAGQADIIRESIDGATMYELLAGVEGWEPTPWLTPWGKEPVTG